MTGPDDFADVRSTRSEDPHLGDPTSRRRSGRSSTPPTATRPQPPQSPPAYDLHRAPPSSRRERAGEQAPRSKPASAEPPLPAAIALCVLVVCRARSAGRLGQGMVDEYFLGTVWVRGAGVPGAAMGGLDDYQAFPPGESTSFPRVWPAADFLRTGAVMPGVKASRLALRAACGSVIESQPAWPVHASSRTGLSG